METKANLKPVPKNFNKPAYVIFIITGTYFLIVKDLSQAVVSWGLALVFDPFNVAIPFQKRPFYQQLWLYIHLAVTLALSIVMLFF